MINEKEIVGVKRMDGKSKRTGRPYAGFMIWYQEQREGVDGVACDSSFLSDALLDGRVPSPGDCIVLSYNRSGFLEYVSFDG